MSDAPNSGADETHAQNAAWIPELLVHLNMAVCARACDQRLHTLHVQVGDVEALTIRQAASRPTKR